MQERREREKEKKHGIIKQGITLFRNNLCVCDRSSFRRVQRFYLVLAEGNELLIFKLSLLFLMHFLLLFAGNVNLKILRADSQDHYRWNKVTTCVHNLFSGQRWADLSGELSIYNLDRNISCKLTFVKVRSIT